MEKKSKLWALALCTAFFYIGLLYKTVQVTLPSPTTPCVFYSNQTRDDLRLVFCSALKKTSHSVYVKMYALTDPSLIQALATQLSHGKAVEIHVDPKATPSLPALPLQRVKTKGLMHQKIFILDQAQLFLGSANMTTSSLALHDNLTLGLWSPEAAHFLLTQTHGSFRFNLGAQKAELYLLPDTEGKAVQKVLHSISAAKSSLYLSMFTLTHPAIIEALIHAHKRGVQVSIALDFYTARGASLKAAELLQKEGIPLHLSRGPSLLHHKWALIDEHTFILGSTNWTKAAFKKNQDLLFFLEELTPPQRTYLKKLWKTIKQEAILKN